MQATLCVIDNNSIVSTTWLEVHLSFLFGSYALRSLHIRLAPAATKDTSQF